MGWDRVAWVWVAAESWNGGSSFITHLQDNLPTLYFSLHQKNVPLLLLGRRRLWAWTCRFLPLRPCGKLALVMSRDPVLGAAIKKGPWVLGRVTDKPICVLKQWNAYRRPQACTSWTLDPRPPSSPATSTSHTGPLWHGSSELCFLIPEPIHPFTHFETMKWPQWLLGPDSIGTSRKGKPAGIGLNDENYCAQKESIGAFQRNSILSTKGLGRQS